MLFRWFMVMVHVGVLLVPAHKQLLARKNPMSSDKNFFL